MRPVPTTSETACMQAAALFAPAVQEALRLYRRAVGKHFPPAIDAFASSAERALKVPACYGHILRTTEQPAHATWNGSPAGVLPQDSAPFVTAIAAAAQEIDRKHRDARTADERPGAHVAAAAAIQG